MEDRVLKTLYKKLKGNVVRRNRIREYMGNKHIDLVSTWKHYYMEFNYRGRSLLLVNKDNYRNVWNYEDTITCAFMVYKGEVYPVNEKSKDKIIKIINTVYDKHKGSMIRNLGVDDSYFETEEDIKDDRLLMIEKLQEYKMKHNLRMSPMFDKDNPYYLRNGYNKRRKRRIQMENETIEFINNDLFRNGNTQEFGYVRILNDDDISNWTFTSNDMSDMFISNRGDI